jgi:hypothetical protein
MFTTITTLITDIVGAPSTADVTPRPDSEIPSDFESGSGGKTGVCVVFRDAVPSEELPSDWESSKSGTSICIVA